MQESTIFQRQKKRIKLTTVSPVPLWILVKESPLRQESQKRDAVNEIIIAKPISKNRPVELFAVPGKHPGQGTPPVTGARKLL